MQFSLCHTHSLSICIKLKESEDLFIWEKLKNVFIPVAIVINRDNDCTITAIMHLKRVILSNNNNTTAMQGSAVIKERWEHRSIACL